MKLKEKERNKFKREQEGNNIEINDEYFNDRRKSRKRKKKIKQIMTLIPTRMDSTFLGAKKSFSLIGGLNQEKMSKLENWNYYIILRMT